MRDFPLRYETKCSRCGLQMPPGTRGRYRAKGSDQLEHSLAEQCPSTPAGTGDNPSGSTTPSSPPSPRSIAPVLKWCHLEVTSSNGEGDVVRLEDVYEVPDGYEENELRQWSRMKTASLREQAEWALRGKSRK